MTEIFNGKTIKSVGEYFVTNGLVNEVNVEFRVKIGNFDSKDYIYVLKYIVDYVFKETPSIKAHETISFNSWVLKFVEFETGFLDLYELNEDLQDFVEGVEYSLKIQNRQITICESYKSKFMFPKFNQKIVISEGVLDGYMVEGVRYKSPEHMSGWWLTTRLYNEDITTLKQINLDELIKRRPELIKYLALDYGFRFHANKSECDIWFDESVASS